MCIFQTHKVEYYAEEPQLFPIYFQHDEADAEHRSRIFVARRLRRLENIARNQAADPINWHKPKR